MSVAHWDDARHERRDAGDVRVDLWFLGGQDLPAGARRMRVDPGARPMPFHRHWAEEELFWVLGGGGVVVIGDAAHEVGPGDVVVRPAGGEAHAFVAGDAGLDLLAFGENLDPAVVELPRAGVVRRGSLWWERGAGDPLGRELDAGPFTVPERAPRPACIADVRDVEPLVEERPGYRGEDRAVSRAGGSVRTGLRHVRMPHAGDLSCPPHWHAEETELFVVLGGEGELVLFDLDGAEVEAHPLRRGSVAVRPPGTGVAHALRVGEGGLEYLAYGTRRPGEVVHYPRSSKVLLGRLMVRVERVTDIYDGEP